MINGDLPTFLDKLYWLEDLGILFQGREYLIQGYGENIGKPDQVFHIEVFETTGNVAGEMLLEHDAKTSAECSEVFRKAPIWDGRSFDEAESEIEWIM